MSALPIRDQLLQELNALSDEQIVTVLEFVQAVKDDVDTADTDVEDDPLVGFISGPTDAAESTKAIPSSRYAARN